MGFKEEGDGRKCCEQERNVQIKRAVAQIEACALDAIQGAVASTHDIVLDEVPQRNLQAPSSSLQDQGNS